MDFADLYTRYAESVFRFAYYLCGNRALAEDIAAETFARALTVRDRIEPGSVKAYLMAVARNLFIDGARKHSRATPLTNEHLLAADPSPDPEVIAGARVDLETAWEALLQVPEAERSALLMAVVAELPHEQIAASLGCSVAAVKLRIHRARVRLRHVLAADLAKGSTRS
jgi:RNA polymerase sigma-70 factor (ECF subfamily)